jgi:uncharacterized protein YoxC
MPLIRDDDQERQERIDRLVKELADMQRSLTATNERAARIAKEVEKLRAAKPIPEK